MRFLDFIGFGGIFHGGGWIIPYNQLALVIAEAGIER